MSDRIKELIAECTYTVTDYKMGIDSSEEKFDKEKFAELIVKECISKISDENEKVEPNWQCKNGVHICWEIKNHFGITT